ncbi:MAG: hypothetical protein M1823_006101 [Watsoniomyces obsoletus]|nr:MAG: hypothetical protein M1823_006101 [Watsoniomyces obsoletus]
MPSQQSDPSYFPSHEPPPDQEMGGVEMASSSEQPNPYSNGYQDTQTQYAPQQHQPADYSQQQYPYSSPSDADPNARFHSPNLYQQQQPHQQQPQPLQRPPSGLDRHGYGNVQPENGPMAYQQPMAHGPSQPAPSQPSKSKDSVVIKVGMVGDAQIGKTSLMVKYVEGSWDEDYIQTLGVNFMEKTISIRNTEITFSIWDLGGQREFVNMLPLVCNDAVAILFMFDLTRKSTLNSIKEWYRQGRGFNKTAIPFLVGTKYDHFVNFPREDQEEISNQARRFAKAMRASLIFSSTSHSINVQKIFKIVLSKAFDLKCTIPEIENVGEPLLLYQSVG